MYQSWVAGEPRTPITLIWHIAKPQERAHTEIFEVVPVHTGVISATTTFNRSLEDHKHYAVPEVA